MKAWTSLKKWVTRAWGRFNSAPAVTPDPIPLPVLPVTESQRERKEVPQIEVPQAEVPVTEETQAPKPPYGAPLFRSDVDGTDPLPIPLSPADPERARKHSAVGGWGVDFAIKGGRLSGVPVRAVGDGVVLYVTTATSNAWNISEPSYEPNGNGVWISLSNGPATGVMQASIHLDVRYVKLNDTVKRGQIIGTVGNTGASFGTHLHQESRSPNFDPMDPTLFDWAEAGWSDDRA